MKRWTTAMATVCLLGAAMASGQEERRGEARATSQTATAGVALVRTAGTLAVPMVTAAPKIDGKLDDEAWKRAQPMRLWSHGGKPALYDSTGYLCRDNENFYFAAFKIGVYRSFRPRPDGSLNPEDILAPRSFRYAVGFSYRRIRRNLNQSGSIAQIDENQSAVISSSLQPTGEGYRFAGIRQSQFPTIFRLQLILVFRSLNCFCVKLLGYMKRRSSEHEFRANAPRNSA